MTELVVDARSKRSQEVLPLLEEEMTRIEKWEAERQTYLKQSLEVGSEAIHGGHFALAKKVKDELETLKTDSKTFPDYISKCLSTDATPDVRILAIFVAAE